MSSKPWGSLPLTRVVTIMRSSSEVENISKDATFIMARATCLFIEKLSQECHSDSKNSKKLDYKHVTDVVHKTERYEFLRDIMPRKVTFGEYKKLMAKKNKPDNEEENESETDSSSSEDSNSGSNNE